MINFEIPSLFAKLGFCASFLANSFVIYLTVVHIRKVVGTYKKMVIMFAVCGILFSGLETIVRPFAHNFNKCIMFFSVNTWLSQLSLQIILATWAGIYLVIMALIAVQFVYRYLCLFDTEKARKFDRMPSLVWMGYPLIPGGFYSLSFYLFCIPDDYSDDCIKDTILKTYGLLTSDIARFSMVPYASDGSLRVKNLSFLASGVVSIWFHYFVILYCGLKMHLNMQKELEKFSVKNRKLQKQFFHALVVQSLGPTIFLVLPVVPILIAPMLSPYLGVEFSWQTGWLYSVVGVYPPFDSIGFMLIVSEYRKVIKEKCLLGCTADVGPSTVSGSVGTTDPKPANPSDSNAAANYVVA